MAKKFFKKGSSRGGKKRKNMPGYYQGVDKLGRTAWLAIKTVEATYDRKSYIDKHARIGDVVALSADVNATVLGKHKGGLVIYDPKHHQVRLTSFGKTTQIVKRQTIEDLFTKYPDLLERKIMGTDLFVKDIQPAPIKPFRSAVKTPSNPHKVGDTVTLDKYLANAAVGDVLQHSKGQWTVVGVTKDYLIVKSEKFAYPYALKVNGKHEYIIKSLGLETEPSLAMMQKKIYAASKPIQDEANPGQTHTMASFIMSQGGHVIAPHLAGGMGKPNAVVNTPNKAPAVPTSQPTQAPANEVKRATGFKSFMNDGLYNTLATAIGSAKNKHPQDMYVVHADDYTVYVSPSVNKLLDLSPELATNTSLISNISDPTIASAFNKATPNSKVFFVAVKESNASKGVKVYSGFNNYPFLKGALTGKLDKVDTLRTTKTEPVKAAEPTPRKQPEQPPVQAPDIANLTPVSFTALADIENVKINTMFQHHSKSVKAGDFIELDFDGYKVLVTSSFKELTSLDPNLKIRHTNLYQTGPDSYVYFAVYPTGKPGFKINRGKIADVPKAEKLVPQAPTPPVPAPTPSAPTPSTSTKTVEVSPKGGLSPKDFTQRRLDADSIDKNFNYRATGTAVIMADSGIEDHMVRTVAIHDDQGNVKRFESMLKIHDFDNRPDIRDFFRKHGVDVTETQVNTTLIDERHGGLYETTTKLTYHDYFVSSFYDKNMKVYSYKDGDAEYIFVDSDKVSYKGTIKVLSKDKTRVEQDVQGLLKRFGFKTDYAQPADLETYKWRKAVMAAVPYADHYKFSNLTPKQIEAELQKMYNVSKVLDDNVMFFEDGSFTPTFSKEFYDKVIAPKVKDVFHDFGAGPSHVLVQAGGLVSTLRRYAHGLKLGGMSSDRDIQTGGAEYVFTRVSSVRRDVRVGDSLTGVKIRFRPEILRRVDQYSYSGDRYGIKDPNDFDKTLVQEMKKRKPLWDIISKFGKAHNNDFVRQGHRNETMFKYSIGVEYMEEILTAVEIGQDTRRLRNALITYFNVPEHLRGQLKIRVAMTQQYKVREIIDITDDTARQIWEKLEQKYKDEFPEFKDPNYKPSFIKAYAQALNNPKQQSQKESSTVNNSPEYESDSDEFYENYEPPDDWFDQQAAKFEDPFAW